MKKKIVFIMMLVMALTGGYICTTNAASSSTLKAPYFTAKPSNQVVTIGEPIQIDAVVTGTPEPTVTWYKDNRTIHSDSIYSLTYKDGRATLRIKDAQAGDTGRYTVRAENSVGTAQASCGIVVSYIE